MFRSVRPWICRTIVTGLLAGCVPHPVYRSSDSPASGRVVRESSERATPKAPSASRPVRPVHPVDPSKLSTQDAYQIGVASYYGKKFHGRKTANGEIFNMYKLTAAHRVLLLGTYIRVTHLQNGHSVEVKVNDRGPFIEGRILDLSFAAALELEMVKAGTAQIMIEILEAD